MRKKSLMDFQREYEKIILSDQPRKDIELAALMAEMRKQFNIPVPRNEAWEKENVKVAAMYRKLIITRTL
ncbi:hypothetical protein MHZ95_17605 [Sporosarcina sp. ACRSM]|uniref:Uncharacterized protein n=1 Tax=Sporosarcina soli TaxID=334736 RepID=A0ABW0TP08_9BACL|nr:hypothetical protein [Sporosarcina sp. ACRSM]MCG7337079.1 hypothetical protein [Sporosarcina sp. ACRSM]